MRTITTATSIVAGLVVWASTAFAQPTDGGYRVFRPEGAGPHPAIAFMSGCNGFAPAVAPRAYERVADRFLAQGFIVLFVDYVGRRGVQNCTIGPITQGDAAKDLVAAVTWLRSRPSVDKTRISALGWSYGAGAILVALADYAEDQLGISRAVVFYPYCDAVRPWTAATPVLMLLAGDDEVAPGERCQAAVRKSADPGAVKTKTYHGALHTFDLPELPSETRGPAGGMVGYNHGAAADAWAEAQRFLRPSR
jgi:dienelactone hydrolase